MISKKVVITGHFGVGKTSLFNRVISNTFNEKYLTTIGVDFRYEAIDLGSSPSNRTAKISNFKYGTLQDRKDSEP